MTLRGLFSPEKSSHERQRANQSKAEKNKSSPVRGHPPPDVSSWLCHALGDRWDNSSMGQGQLTLVGPETLSLLLSPCYSDL